MGFAEEAIYDFDYEGTKYYYIRRSKADKVVVEKDKYNKNRYIAVYKCCKCHGKGEVHWLRDNGICYDCGGKGFYTIILDPTKNLQTAERRLNKIITDRDNRYNEFRNDNLKKTMEKYSKSFYAITDDKKSTYNEREYLKSLGAKWNPDARCWTIKEELIKGNELEGFKTFRYITEDTLNEYYTIDSSIISQDISKWGFERIGEQL